MVLEGLMAALPSLIGGGASLATNLINYGQQKDAFDWEKAQMDLTRSREDNAIQRRVADLKAAGMSPVLATGSGAASASPIHVQAPQYAGGDVEAAMSILQGQRNIAQTNAQIMATNQLARKNQAEADIAERESNIQKAMDKLNWPYPGAAGYEGVDVEANLRRLQQFHLLNKIKDEEGLADIAQKGAKWNYEKAVSRGITFGNSEASSMADIMDLAKSGGSDAILLNLLLQMASGSLKNLIK